MSQIALPNKFFEYAACGRPIISTELPEVRRIAGNQVLFYKGPEGFADQVTGVLQNEKSSAMFSQPMVDLAKRYDWDLVSAKLEAMLRNPNFGGPSK
jgi:glycosyltransferase involved in cell wall biosynthesis